MAFVWGDENESAKKKKKEQLVRKETNHERVVFWKPNNENFKEVDNINYVKC